MFKTGIKAGIKIVTSSALLGLGLAACGATPNEELTTASEDEFVIELLGEETLFELVEICQGATGTNFTFDDEVARGLEAETTSISGRIAIPAAEFDDWFENALRGTGYRCARIGSAELNVMQIMR